MAVSAIFAIGALMALRDLLRDDGSRIQCT